MNTRITALIAAILSATLAAALHAQSDRAAACTALANAALPNTSITAVQAVTGGSFTVPGSTNTMNNLPPFCRVAGTIKPTAESDIRFEVWLPLDNWNGKFAGRGKRRMGGGHFLRTAPGTAAARICVRFDQHRPSGRSTIGCSAVRLRASRAAR